MDRINEILSDNSQWLYNFNGIYDLKEAKLMMLYSCRRTKMKVKITILNKGALNIVRII